MKRTDLLRMLSVIQLELARAEQKLSDHEVKAWLHVAHSCLMKADMLAYNSDKREL